MASRTNRPGESSPFTSNQRFLLATSVLLGAAAVFLFVALSRVPDGMPAAIVTAGVLVVLGLIPLFLIRRSRRRGRRGTMSNLVRSSFRAGRGFTDVEITCDQALPKVCIRCGTATRRVSPFRFLAAHTEASPYDWSRLNPFLFLFIAWKFTVQLVMTKLWMMFEKWFKRRKSAGGAVVFKIPHCKDCARGNPVVQRHFDFHGRRMIVEVHPVFREQLRNRSAH